MRIGIITLPLHHNYGGILQAYALQTVLERMGHEVYLIEKKYKIRHLPLIKAPFIYGKRILKNLVGQRTPIFYEKKIYLERPITHQYTNKFQETYIKKRIVEKYTDIREGDFDTIIVGSDQIWRPIYFPNIEQAFLKFTKGWKIQRIAYAASFGTDNWEYTTKQTRECGNLLKMFKKALQKSEVDPANYHSLRHTFATRCIELGFDVKRLSEILGHASVSITMNRYVHPSMELKKENMQRLSSLFAVK